MLFISRRRVAWKQNVVVESRCVLVVDVQFPTVRCVCSQEYESTCSELCPLQRLCNDLQATTSAPKTVKLATVKLATLRDHNYYCLPSLLQKLCLLQRLCNYLQSTMFGPKSIYLPAVNHVGSKEQHTYLQWTMFAPKTNIITVTFFFY